MTSVSMGSSSSSSASTSFSTAQAVRPGTNWCLCLVMGSMGNNYKRGRRRGKVVGLSPPTYLHGDRAVVVGGHEEGEGHELALSSLMCMVVLGVRVSERPAPNQTNRG